MSLKVHILDIDFFNNPSLNNFYRHELIHLKQIAYYGKIKFLFKYIIFSIKYGYYKNPFELQAYKYQKSFDDKMLNNEFEQVIESIYYK